MEYRALGATGLSVSAIGLGCENLDTKPYEQVKATIGAALDHGVNIFDVFMPGHEIRAHIAQALGKRRGDVIVQGHVGSTDIKQAYDISRDMPTVRKYFEDILRAFGYIDLGMLFFIDSQKDYHAVFDTEFITYVQRLKQEGAIRHIGFSSHNPDIATKVVETGAVETMMFSINPAFDMLPSDEYVFDHMDKDFGVSLFRGIDPRRAALYKLCEQKQVGITVMKTLGGGKLISPEHSPFARPLTVAQCAHYALSRPAVASALLGSRSPEEVAEAMRYFDLSDDEKDYAPALASLRNDFRGNCVYCGHCQPCPAEIDIAAVNKYLDIARLDTARVPPSIRSHYQHLAHGGAECVACGNCEERCPFGVPVIENMRDAERLLAHK